MNDLTTIFITAGKRPPEWVKFHKEQLDRLPYPMITMRDEEKKGEQMIYQRLLEGCKQATTPFVAVLEDDVLYPPEHFKFRPKMDEFAYNQHRWALFTWGVPTYNWRNRVSNCSLIAPRKLVIEVIEERNAKWPDGWKYVGELGRWRIDRVLGTKPRKLVQWHSTVALVQINHDDASEERQRIHWKDLGPVRAFDIPVWGKSSELIKRFC